MLFNIYAFIESEPIRADEVLKGQITKKKTFN